MKKHIIHFLVIFLSGTVYSQVGVYTQKPQGTFHVDGAKDNPSTESTAVTAEQEVNDFIVTSGGNVGVGLHTPLEKIDIQGNIRVRAVADGSNIAEFPNVVVMKTDGTLGAKKAFNISLQSYQLKIPPHASNNFPDFSNHTNTSFDSEDWWVISKTSINPITGTIPPRMTIVYEFQGPVLSDPNKIFPQMTSGNNSEFPDVFVPSFISLQTVGGKTRLTVSITRADHFVSGWGGTFLLNVLFAIRQ